MSTEDDTAPPFDTTHDAAVLEAVRALETKLHALLGRDVYLVTVVAFSDGAGVMQLQRSSNCEDVAAYLLAQAMALPLIEHEPMAAPRRQ